MSGFFPIVRDIRILVAAAVLLIAAVLVAGVPARAQDARAQDARLQEADAAYHEGRYDEARRLYRAGLPATADGYARAFEAEGAYEEALEAITGSTTPELCARGRVLTAVGRYDEAEAALMTALQRTDAYWMCGTVLAELWAKTGRDREARSLYMAIFERHQQGLFRSAEDLTAAALSAAALEQFRDANDAFRRAHDVAPRNVESLYHWAELFRAKYNDADARRTYQDALAVNPRHAPSMVGLALATPSFAQKEELAQEALAINPRSVAALNLLASLRILDGAYDEASSLAERALAVNSNSVGSLAQLASAAKLRGDEAAYAQAERRALAVDPQAIDFFVAVEQNMAHRFRYPDAVDAAHRAVEVDPADAEAHAAYGAALLRLGRRDEARRHLQTAYERDPYNLFASNMLTLLDAYDDFSLLESPHFRLLIHSEERDVMGPLILETAEAAYDELSSRYPYRPADKIVIEAYNDPADFAVRISGVPHQGLLGVAFGDVVAVNTPAAQPGGAYNWARTLWHEIAHTMAIGVSAHHVPRWFTEGLSLYEEQRARPEWAREMEPTFLAALDEGGLHPLDEIDRGFTRPAYPGQVMLSYYHASRVIAYVVDTFGFDAVVDVLRGLADGLTDDAAMRAATGIGLAELDRRFRADAQDRGRRVAQALGRLPSPADADEGAGNAGAGPFFTELQKGSEALARRDFEAAEAAYSDALERYPAYVGAGNAYEGLAVVYRERGDDAALAGVLTRYLAVAEDESEAAVELAELLAARGDAAGAARALERSLHVAPYDAAVRTRLAELYEEMDRFDDAVDHRRAVLALQPADRAGAYFRLARSLAGRGSTADARRAVVLSLEIAPDYRDAQRLLLDLAE